MRLLEAFILIVAGLAALIASLAVLGWMAAMMWLGWCMPFLVSYPNSYCGSSAEEFSSTWWRNITVPFLVVPSIILSILIPVIRRVLRRDNGV